MRIAYVCTDPGIPVFGRKGASVHAQAVLTELVRAGHEVHLCTPRPGDRPPASDLLAAVTVHQLPAVGRGVAAEREQRAQLSDGALDPLLSAIEPELVYERYALWGRTATQWCARHGVPSVLEVNAPLVEEQARFRELADAAGARAVACSALGLAGTVVCVSEPVADWARATGARPGAVLIEPNGVDPDRITVAPTLPAPASATAFTVGFVGTLKPWHGLETLLDATIPLLRADASWRLLLVGDGPLAGQLTVRLHAAGVAGQAEFTGAVAPAEVAAQLHRVDIACAPYPAEGSGYFSPLKVYEYLAAGLPVVASAVGQLPAALDDGRLGRLVRPGDAEALAAALVELRSDADRRTELRAAGRRAVLERHTWAQVVQRTLAHRAGRRAA